MYDEKFKAHWCKKYYDDDCEGRKTVEGMKNPKADEIFIQT